MTLSGRSRLIANSLGTLHDISSDGRALVGRDIVRTRLLGLPPGEAREREFSWLDSSIAADLSADGTTLLFAEEGEGGGGVGVVYFRKTDGSPPVRLGEGYALALSPDKKWALAAPINFTELLLLPTGTGQAKKLERGGIESYQSARFLPDSKRILFAGKERGRRARLYIQDPDGGGPRAITPEGAGAAFRGNLVSPDGRFVTGPGADKGFDLYPVEGGLTDSDSGVGKEKCRSNGRPTSGRSTSIDQYRMWRASLCSTSRADAEHPGRISFLLTPRDRAWSSRLPSRPTESRISTATARCCRTSSWSRG